MILDLNERQAGEALECDVCVVGSGPAAISLALRFDGSGHKVVMLESGGLEQERAVQKLYQGETLGYRLANGLMGSRSRFFGGSSNCWAGACTPLDAIDFRVRDWVPNSGWPIGPEAFAPYHDSAQQTCLVGPYLYDDRLAGGDPDRQFAFAPDTLEMGYWQFASEPRLGKHYREQFGTSQNITAVLHATVTAMETDAAGSHVHAMTAKSLGGASVRIRARTFVLACGGIENARLLLAANDRMPVGLGNANGLVGRYFMEHPVCVAATVVPRHPGDPRLGFLNVFSDPSPKFQGTRFNALLKTKAAFQEKHRILNSALFLVDHDSEFSEGLMAAVRLRQALQERQLPDDLVRDVLKVMGDLPNVAQVAYGRYVKFGNARRRLGLKLQAETVPNPDSRVTLSHKRDAFGQPLAKLDWKMVELDRRTLDVLMDVVRQEFDRLDLADIQLDQWMRDSPDTFPDDMRGGVHHTGTTRMSAHPADGVVDTDCRMHTVDNLYVAGSSVFPTNSWANPTWLISCLAIRLADHLIQRLAA